MQIKSFFSNYMESRVDIFSTSLFQTPFHFIHIGFVSSQRYALSKWVDTKTFHPNIDDQGRVCLNILREDWTPSIDLSQVACSLQYLLTEPNADDPLDNDAAACLLHHPEQFQTRVDESYVEQPESADVE